MTFIVKNKTGKHQTWTCSGQYGIGVKPWRDITVSSIEGMDEEIWEVIPNGKKTKTIKKQKKGDD